ncbi:hypothetical protein H4R20_005335 [Coemansia guatemalensis]|uniref:Uncharacterized protein n=1 Tax=Coemansia guatemalensis TaxID=2761395 RepID=A0A9W8HQI6_9FUNG|nr:hypothetical protein H4R20_005335 [Coemansia guatemalensis]
MGSPAWLIDYYCSIVDVLSPACGLAVAVSAVVLVSMYTDTADTVTVRVSGMLGLSGALYQISQLIIRELAARSSPEHQLSAAARIFAFCTYFLQLLNILLVNRIALDLKINFLGWCSCSRFLRWVFGHYAVCSIALAFVLSCPLFFAPARFDPVFLYAQWSFGSNTRNILYMIFSFYLWVVLLLLDFAAVIIAVIIRLRTQLPSNANPTTSLSTHVMRSVEQQMRRKARVLILYPLSPMIFYSPVLAFYWVQSLHLEQTNATRAIWITSVVVGPLQTLYDFMVFALLPPVQRIVCWYSILHKDSDTYPLVEHMQYEPIDTNRRSDATLTNEEAWIQDVAVHRVMDLS